MMLAIRAICFVFALVAASACQPGHGGAECVSVPADRVPFDGGGCGGAGQSCCTPDGGGTSTCAAGLTCDGICEPCGALGASCCLGVDRAYCLSGMCELKSCNCR